MSNLIIFYSLQNIGLLLSINLDIFQSNDSKITELEMIDT